MNPEISKNLKFNVVVNLLDGAFFGFGIGFASFSTILPLFVRTMTDSAILIGLIPAIHTACWQLPQLLTINRVARQKRFKPMVMILTIQERLPFLGLAIIAWSMVRLDQPLALVLTFSMLVWQGLGGGFTAAGWQSMIAKIIPADRRGTFFGMQAAAANLFASVSAIIAGYILEANTGTQGFALCFLFTVGALIISWFMMGLTREPATEPEQLFPESTNFWSKIWEILRRDANFRWLLVTRMLTQLGIMGFAFYTVYAVHQHNVSEAEIGWMTGVLLATQIIANPLLGWLGDHWSNRGVMEIGLAASMLSALLAWWAPSPAWFYPVFVLTGIAAVSIWTIWLAIIPEFGSEAERPAYIGLANTLVAPAVILAPFLGGWLADRASYPVTFIASAISALVTWAVLHFLVKDPKKRT